MTVPKGMDPLAFLKTSEAKYVLLGIPEDIGIRANYGRPGAASTEKRHWQHCHHPTQPVLQRQPNPGFGTFGCKPGNERGQRSGFQSI